MIHYSNHELIVGVSEMADFLLTPANNVTDSWSFNFGFGEWLSAVSSIYGGCIRCHPLKDNVCMNLPDGCGMQVASGLAEGLF